MFVLNECALIGVNYFILGTIYRLKGGIINISFLDSAGNVIPDSLDLKDKDKEEKRISKLRDFNFLPGKNLNI